MADFRRWFIALAVLALAAGLASAQIGTAGSTSAGPLNCTANGAAIPQLRSEGFTELVGDILISCVGGTPGVLGKPVPTVNITVLVSGGTSTYISSRLGSGTVGTPPTGTVSEVALLIDEPGSGLSTGAAAGYGPTAPQVLCATQAGCPTYYGTDGNGYQVAASTAAGGTNAANIYQGYINAVGNNSVTFYGVPVLPPVTSGVSRIFRITNIRYPAAVNPVNQTQITAGVTTSPSQNLPLVQASFPIGVIIDPSLTSVASATLTPFPQCGPQTNATAGTVTFTEGFATAFKTRVVPNANLAAPPGTLYAAEATNAGVQNIPGGTYGGFASNSESGFIVAGDTLQSVYTAGLADFGTRLKAVFTNIPLGLTLSVGSSSNVALPAGEIVGGATLNASYAVLISTGTGETLGDGTNFSTLVINPAFNTPVPLITTVAGGSTTATAIWEVTNSQPSSIDSLQFNVYISYTPSAATTTNPYGLPTPTQILNLNLPLQNVSLSYAPEPSQGAFSLAAGPYPGTNPIPRFNIVHPYNYGPLVKITLCQTTLLYPFVTANPAGALGQGFDTGIAISNTSMDPFGTAPYPITNHTTATPQNGSCTLYPYGVTLSSAGAASAPPATKLGCDMVASPVPGTNCFPVVGPGTVQTVLASTIFPGFQGYVIAICNFQYAHGYAAVTDLGLRGLFSSYLALELAPNSFGTAGRGVSIEQLVH